MLDKVVTDKAQTANTSAQNTWDITKIKISDLCT